MMNLIFELFQCMVVHLMMIMDDFQQMLNKYDVYFSKNITKIYHLMDKYISTNLFSLNTNKFNIT